MKRKESDLWHPEKSKAKKILRNLERSKVELDGRIATEEEKNSLFREVSPEETDVLKEISELDIDCLRPIDALRLLEEWQDYLKHE